MKKLLALLLLSTFALASCVKDCDCPPYPPSAYLTTTYFDVYPSDWRSADTYVYATLNLPQITKNVLKNGAVLAYSVDGDDRDNILPYVFPEFDGNTNLMKNIRYDVNLNQITFIVEYSDFSRIYPSGTWLFKVVVMQM